MNRTPLTMTTQISMQNRSTSNNARILLLFTCLLLFSALLIPVLAKASVTATVDRSAINEGETFTLNLSVSGGNSSQPDLSVLHKDFDVLGTGQNSSIQIINGSVQSHHSWSITLSPQHTGTLTIPPITVGSERSQALTITVLPATASTATKGVKIVQRTIGAFMVCCIPAAMISSTSRIGFPRSDPCQNRLP